MDIKNAIETINSRAKEYLQPAKKEGFICPICKNGSGENGTGLATRDGIHFTCFKCNEIKNSSLLDIIAKESGIDTANTLEAVKVASSKLGITLDYSPTTDYQTAQKQTKNTQKNTIINFNSFIPASQNETARAYLQERGITPETADRFNLRYSLDVIRTKEGKAPALIIPTGDSSYIARNLNRNCDKGDRYRKTTGQYNPFNIKALESSTAPIFITEGEIDAISIMQAGGEAIALGGQAIDVIINRALELNYKQPLIITLDNDDTGLVNTEKLKARKEELNKQGLKLYFPNLKEFYLDFKDANELLVNNDFYFENIVREAIENANNLEELEKQELILQLKRDSVASYKNDFDSLIESSKTASYIPTGFKKLDELLDGGLYSGLYIVGAISSLGKTTLCLQIADQIAQAQKKDVLIFSLEMSKSELIAKSISRITSILDIERSNSNTNAKTTRGILTGSKYANYNNTELQLINDSKELYFKDIAPNVYIYEGMGNIGVTQVRAKVEAYKKITGQAPIVLIDYLQLLQPAPESRFNTDKQITDFNIMELKRISRDYQTSVIGISSFNRDNYTAPVNMASFKESGAIEYSSDVLIGLQYKAFTELSGGSSSSSKEANKNKVAEITADINQRAKDKRPIEIQLVVLKNRNGSKGTVDLEFFPMFNKFIEPRNLR